MQKHIHLLQKALCLTFFSVATLQSSAQTYLRQDFEAPFTGTTTLTTAMAPSGSATTIPANQNWTQHRTIIRHDGFPDGLNSGTGNDQDWERNVNTGTTAWTLAPTSAGTRPDAAVSGTGVLWFNNLNAGSIAGEYMRTLLSPTLDLTTSTSPYARFWLFSAGNPALVPVRVVASKDNGATWKSIMIIPSGFANTSSPISSSPWQQVNVIIPAEFRAANVKIGLEASPDGQVSNIWIDDFTVEEFTPTTITSAATGDWNTAATWTGGVVPNANNHVVIAHAVTTNNLAAMTRCQNLTIQATGTLTMTTTTFAQLMHVMGDLTVDAGGNGNFRGTATTGKLLYIGGNAVNNGNLDFGIPPTATTQSQAGLYFCGGSPATYSGTGTVGIAANRTIPAIMHNNASGVTYNAPLVVSSNCILYDGAVNPNGNLTFGQNIAAFDFTVQRSSGTLTARPIWGTLTAPRVFNLRYASTNEARLSKQLIQTGHEVRFDGTAYTVTGSLFVSTFDNIELTFPMSVGSGITTGGFWTMSRGIIYSTPTNLLTINALSNAAMTNGSSQSVYSSGAVNNHGSYVIGTLRVNFGTGFSVSRQFPMGLGGNFCTPSRNNNALKLVTFTNSANWANQSVLVSLEANPPTGNVNMPLLALASTISYRVQDIGATPLTPTTSNISFVGVNTDFAPNSNNLQGDGANLRIAQSLVNTAGTWTNRSTSGSTAGAIVNNTNYTVNTAASGHLPIATNGEFFTFASISPACTGTPTPANTLATATTIGVGGSVRLSLQNATAGIGVSYQWQSSTDNGVNFNNVTGEIGATYLATNITQSTQYRCVVTCTASNQNATSNPVTVNLIAAPAGTNGTGCGSPTNPTTIQLNATGTGLQWFATANSTTVLGTGSPFAATNIGATTNFFVSNLAPSAASGIGLADNTVGTFAAAPTKGQALLFTTLGSGTLNSVAVYPAAAGTSTIQLYNSTGANALGAAVVATFTAAQIGTKVTVPLNIAIPSAGSYRLVNENVGADVALGQISLLAPTTTYPFLSSNGLVSIFASATTPTGAANFNIYNSFFDLNISTLALSPRTSVTATISCSAPPPPPAPASQTITFDALPDRIFSTVPFTLVATASSGLPVSFTVVSGNLAVGGNTASMTGLGEVVVEATQSGNFAFLAATPVRRTFRILPAPQSIVGFDSIPDRAWNSGNFFVNARSSSGLPVVYTITAGQNIASILPAQPNLVVLNTTTPAVGRVTITATVPAGGNFAAATTLTRSFNVVKANQSIGNIIAPFNGVFGQLTTATVSASATSNLPVTTTVTGNATIVGNTLTINGAGNISLTFAQAGNDLWNAATNVVRTFEVAKANQTIRFTQPINPLLNTAINLGAVASSNLPVSIRIVSGTGTVNQAAGTVNMTAGGETVLELTQAGNDNFNAAVPVQVRFIAVPNIILTSLSAARFCGGANITINYTTDGTFPAGNIMAAYISDANGNFTNAISLGNFPLTTSGSVQGLIPTFVPSGTGYRVQIRGIIYGVVSNASPAIAIDRLPDNPFINYAQNGDLQVVTPIAGLTFQWVQVNANGTTTNVGTGNTFKPTANGNYQVGATASGCTVFSNVLTFSLPVVTAAEDLTLSQATQVYPNPHEGEVMIKTTLAKAGLVKISVTDVVGKEVYQFTETATAGAYEHKLHLQHVAAGVYVISLSTDGKTATKKTVKQ